MSKPSRFFTIETSQISEIANRIERRMRKLHLSVSKLSAKCSIVSEALGHEQQPALSRSRIAKILMNRGPGSSRSAARVIARSELIVLARALEVSVEWLSGQGNHEDPIVWNVLAEPERADHLLHLMQEHEDRVSEVVVWSEYPLCSFVTQEFMYAFHRIHFREIDDLENGQGRERLVEFFNRMGNSRRSRVLQPNRSFGFSHIINESEIQGIAAGAGIYRLITKSVRRRCLEHFVEVLSDFELKLKLVIANDKATAAVRSLFRDFETLGVMGDLFSVWNYHSGSIGWSENPKYVSRHRKYLQQMRQATICNSPKETCDYLKRLLRKA
ncbi:MAG TPA: hypothetical protein VNG71_01960 [Pyrinomonadaceae bacterium]|nr:hypothetical protein [Pyrinomonadaceae bacterium]